MKKEELQIGSWIKIPSCEYFCDEEDFSSGYAEVTSLGRYELDTTSLTEIGYDEIVGIPITEEILEEIGFKKDGYTNLSPDYFLESSNLIISINLKPGCDKNGMIWVENKETKYITSIEIPRVSLSDKTLYVHQLQNLLNLCGITNFIINL